MALILAEAMIERGHKVDMLLCRREGPLLPLVHPDCTIIDFNVPRFRDALMPLRQYLQQSKPQSLVVFMWPLTVLAVLARMMVRSDTRLILTDHNALSKLHGLSKLTKTAMRRSIRYLYPKAEARIVVSEGVAEDLAELSGLEENAFTVIYNPVSPPPEGLSPDDGAKNLWGSGKRVLSVGALRSQKNQALLIKAFARIKEHIDANMVILGEGPLRGGLEELARSLGLADRVKLPGFLANPWPYYSSADVFVLSSDYEGLGNVLVEALYAGLPIVTTDCPHGPAEILDGGRFGTLVECGDEDGLAEAVIQALGHTVDRDALKARARNFVPEQAIDRYVAILEA